MRAGYWKTGLTQTNFLEAHEVSGAHPRTPHRENPAAHVMCQQDSGGTACFHFLPHCPPPTRIPALESAFCWQKKKKTQERDSKGSLTSLHAVRTSLAKLGCLTSWLQHNRWIYPRCTEPNILPQTGASSKCWLGV